MKVWVMTGSVRIAPENRDFHWRDIATPQLQTTPGRFQGRRVCDWGSFSGHGGALAQEVPQTLGDEGWRLLVRREVVEAVQYFHCCIGDHLLEGGK